MFKHKNNRLYEIKKLFTLNHNSKIQFFKSFILPLFDYCLSLSIYFSNCLIFKIEKLYNNCIFKLLQIDLSKLSITSQNSQLKTLNILPFQYRILYRLSLFTYKCNQFELTSYLYFLFHIKEKCLTHNLRKIDDDLYTTPDFHNINLRRKTYLFLPIFVNHVLLQSLNFNLNLFKSNLLNNLDIIF